MIYHLTVLAETDRLLHCAKNFDLFIKFGIKMVFVSNNK